MTTHRPNLPAHEAPVSLYIPFSHHVTDSIVATRTWEYLTTWRLEGRSFEGYSDTEQQQWIEEINNVLRGWPSGFGLWTHLVRRRVSEYPESDYPDAFSEAHDSAYRRVFDGKPPMINEMYITVLMRPQIDPALKLLSSFEKRTRAQALAWQRQAIEQLEDINRKLAGTLKRYAPEKLTVVQRPYRLADGGTRVGHFSEPAEFFGMLINGRWSAVPITESRLYTYLANTRQFFAIHGEQAETRGADWSRRYVMLEVREYSNSTRPGHFNCLLNQSYEFVLSQSFGSMSKPEGLKALTRQIKWLEDSGDFSETQIADLKQARDDLSSGKFVMGDHHATLQVFGEDSDQALRGAAEISGALANTEVVVRIVDRALVAAWAAQLPGNWIWRPRPCPITSQNFLCFASMHNYLFGKPAGNPWGPAVTMLKTTGGTPYYMNFHASLDEVDDTGKRRLGNTSIIGKSGTGKTVVLGHLIAQARKFDLTAAIFDKDRGMQVSVMQMGGRYFPMHMGVPTGWNYLQLEPTQSNVAFMVALTRQLAANGTEPASMSEQRQIEVAVKKLTEFLDRPERRLSTLLQFLPAAPSEGSSLSLRERLERWTCGHANGWLLDNESDQLDLTVTNLFGFDLTEFLDHDEIRDAALMYLLYRTEQMIDGRRFAYFFDEVQHPLKVPYFQSFMQDKSRTIRKENGVFVFATQEPEAITESAVGRSMIQQSATQIYLPNPEASEKTYVEDFKLTSAEFRLIKHLGEFSRQFVIKQSGSAVTAELDLSTCPDSLLVFSGSADMAELAEKAIRKVGPNPESWLPHYLDAARDPSRK